MVGRTPIRLEAGTRHLLAYCTECPSWRRLSGTRAEAQLTAAAHMDLAHGDAKMAAEYRHRAKLRDDNTPD